ncbi:MAG TPA: hypothetical protein VIW24_15375 [Aldersonia sp.]
MVGIDDGHLLDEQSALAVHQIVLRRHLTTVVLTVRTGTGCDHRPVERRTAAAAEGQPLSKAETASLLECVLASDVESSTEQRVWHYTRGKLRQLIVDELATGRFMQ